MLHLANLALQEVFRRRHNAVSDAFYVTAQPLLCDALQTIDGAEAASFYTKERER